MALFLSGVGTEITLRWQAVSDTSGRGTPDGRDEAALMNNAKRVATDKPATVLSNSTIRSAEDAKAAVLDSAGAIVPVRDAVDRRVVQELL